MQINKSQELNPSPHTVVYIYTIYIHKSTHICVTIHYLINSTVSAYKIHANEMNK